MNLYNKNRIPAALVFIIDADNKFPDYYYTYTLLLALSNSSLNPIFYALTNPNFQKGYWNVWKIMRCQHKLVKSDNTLSNNVEFIVGLDYIQKFRYDRNINSETFI